MNGFIQMLIRKGDKMKYIEQIKNFKASNEQEAETKDKVMELFRKHGEKVLGRDVDTHLTASGFIINKDFNKILFIHHKIRSTWAWTGGHMDGDDDIVRVAIREAKEETGINNIEALTGQVDSLDMLFVEGHLRKGEFVKDHYHIGAGVILIADETEQTVVNDDETNGLKWFDFDELDSGIVSDKDVEIYSKLIERALEYKNSNK